MTALDVMTEHPEDETLAAFIDDRLKPNDKRVVTEHLSRCEECRTFVLDITEFKTLHAAEEGAENVVVLPKRGGWRAAAASLAVAAGLAVVFSGLVRDWAFGSSFGELREAVAPMPHRPVEGRLSVELPYKPPQARMRGTESETAGDEAAARIDRELADLAEARWPNPHTRGVAYLMAGPEYYDRAIDDLRLAAARDQPATVDLAAALLARDSDADRKEALELSKQSRSPEALWNKAMAYEKLGQYELARQAWTEYLAVDSSSKWADEARRKIEQLAPTR